MTDHHGPEYVRAQAQTKAAALQKKAARFAEAVIPSPVFKKPFTDGKTRLTVRFDYPGVLRVIDPTTGEVLAESAPGKPGELSADFKKAERFTEAVIPSPVFKKPFTDGKTRLTVRFDYPGVLRVIDPTTGEVLAESAPGKPGELSADFVPPTPALARTVTQ